MKSVLSLLLPFAAAATLAGCQRGESREQASASAEQAAPTTAPYARDIERLCNVIVRSGADKVPTSERALPIANWLADNLETSQSRTFLVHIQPLEGEAKARALDEEARRVGVGECPLSAEWRN
jgi:hypothetical protein